jgi:hypothetical protein
MTLMMMPAESTAECGRCRTLVAPVVTVMGGDGIPCDVQLCVTCLANGIDMATGWRITGQVLHSLAVSDTVQRFRDPLQQTRKSRRASRVKVYKNRTTKAARAAAAGADDPALGGVAN